MRSIDYERRCGRVTGYNELRDGQEFYGNGYKKGYEDAKKEYARPQGKWMEKEETPASVSYYCSNCEMEGIPVTPFCPWCGAEMHETEAKND